MSSISHPSLPSSGYYSLFPATSLIGDFFPQVHSPSVGERVRRSQVNENESGNYSPIQIWDVRRDQLMVSYTGTGRQILSRPEVETREALNCSANMRAVDNLFKNYYGRWLLNSKDHRMRVYINEPSEEKNCAWWNPYTDSVHISEVDLNYFKPFSENMDIIVHEFGHGFIYYNSPLGAAFQSGALNESIPDVIAIMAKHYRNQAQANDPDTNWLIGDGVLLNARSGTALRSMSCPGSAHSGHPIRGTDSQPSHMNYYQHASIANIGNDNGYIHDNAGIPNKAFYLSAREIGGGSWEKAGCIWLTALLNASFLDEFEEFACRTMAAVKRLNYGVAAYQSVGNAWQDVGVDIRKHGYKNFNIDSQTIQQLNNSIYYFSRNMFSEGLSSFDAAAGNDQVAINQVYKNFWLIKQKPRNVDLRFGEYCFRHIHGHQSTCYENVKAVEMYRNALREYETIDYLTPAQVSLRSRVVETTVNALFNGGATLFEGIKTLSRTTGIDIGMR